MNTELTHTSQTSIRLPSRAIAYDNRKVTKRDGSPVPFDLNRISRAIALAFFEVKHPHTQNLYRDDFLAGFGLEPDDFMTVTKISERASKALEVYYRQGKYPNIEDVQNAVIASIATAGHFDVATAYMAYRMKQTERRLSQYRDIGMESYIEANRYMQWNPAKRRRETWSKAVNRVENMHRTFYADRLDSRFPSELPADISQMVGPHAALIASMFCGKKLSDIIADAFASVNRKEVLPSMRTLQFGGKACLQKHARVYNCAFTNIDRLEAFKETFYLLLCGTGCGFSVQKHHIGVLPALPMRKPSTDLDVEHFEIEDSIEGWADSLHALIMSYFETGKLVEFSYRKIRAKGAQLKTSGGKAPGHLPLKKALTQIDQILAGAAGR